MDAVKAVNSCDSLTSIKSLDEDLQPRFDNAVQFVNEHINASRESVSDARQKELYGYYKVATVGAFQSGGSITSFLNITRSIKDQAWQQVSHLSKEEAQQAYIDLVDTISQELDIEIATVSPSNRLLT